MKVLTYLKDGKVINISSDDLVKMKTDLTASWEKACDNCGKCCFEKVNKNGSWVIDYTKPCKFLKFVGHRSECTVYEKRFDKCPTCVTVPEAITRKSLPSSCAYIKSLPQYLAPIDKREDYEKARSVIAKGGGFGEGVGNTNLGGTPTAGTMNEPAKPPIKNVGGLTREDLAKPKEWKRRREALRERVKRQKQISQGKIGTSDPRQKLDNSRKPSGHALGG